MYKRQIFSPTQADGSIPTITSATLDPSDPSAVRLTLSHFLEPATIDVNVLASGLTFNGSAGADSSVQFRSLPGDVNSSDRVLFGGDATAILPRIGAQLGAANYDFRADVDGSGRILFADAAQVTGRLADFLNSPPSFQPVTFQPITLSATSSSVAANAESDGILENSSAPYELSGAIEEDDSLETVDDTFADLFGQDESDAVVDAITNTGTQTGLDTFNL